MAHPNPGMPRNHFITLKKFCEDYRLKFIAVCFSKRIKWEKWKALAQNYVGLKPGGARTFIHLLKQTAMDSTSLK